MMILARPAVSLALLALAACGSMSSGGLSSEASSRLAGLATGRKMPAASPVAAPDLSNAKPGDILIVTLLGRGLTATLTRQGANNGKETWVSPGGVAMTFQQGILVASRGLSEDMMGADVSEVMPALLAGSGTIHRMQSYLDSEDQIQTRDLTCTITRVGTETIPTVTGPLTAAKLTEACQSDALAFTNSYWLSGGEIMQSRQVLSPSVGFIQVNPT
jgi:hypothetical protein